MRSGGFVLSFTFARHVDLSLVGLSPLDRMAGTNEELDNEGWSGWPVGTVSVWEALVQSQQSGRSSTRLSGGAGDGTGHFPWEPVPSIATWPSAWAREWETRLYADTYSLAIPRTPTPSRDRHPLLPIFLRIVIHEDLGAPVPRGTCYAEERSLSPYHVSTYTRTAYVHKGLVLHFVRYPPAFILRESISRVAPRLL